MLYLFGHGATSVLTAGVGYWIYIKTDMPANEWLAVYLGSITVLSAVAGARILVADELYQSTVLIVYSLLGVMTPLLLVGFALAYLGRNPRTDRVFHVFVLALIPLVLLIITSPVHDYHFGAVTIHETPFPHYESAGSIGRLGAIVYALLAYLVFVYYFVLLYLKSRHRPSVAILVFALGFAFSFSVVFTSELGFVPVETYDHMPFGIGVQALTIAYATAVLGLQDISPMARDELIEELGDPFFALDRNHRLLDYNAAGGQLVGNVDNRIGSDSLRSEHVGQSLSGVFPKLADTLSESETDRQLTVSISGEQRHYSVRISPVTDWRDVRGYAVILRDITDLVQSQRRIERQNEQLDQFASVVSHDLRNPLMTARGYLELVQETNDLEHLTTIDQAHERIEQMITELLQIARVGGAVDEMKSVSIATQAHHSWAMIQPSGATLTVAIPEAVQIGAHQDSLRRLFENLFANAITHNESPVQVTVGLLGDESVEGFFVEDDGTGISAADPNAVFESGYTTADTGTGLGLSIVKNVVDAHGWEITVTEGSTGGARFEITGLERLENATASEASSSLVE